MIKILEGQWLTNFPVTSGENKSFGPITISDFHGALKTVKSGKKALSDLEIWISETGYLNTYPIELVVNHTEEAFAHILNEYNNGITEFLAKNHAFYLWLQPVKQ